MLTFKNTVTFAQNQTPPVLLRNYFEPENGFVWSTSKWSDIIFNFGNGSSTKPRSADLVLDLDVFKAPPKLPHQTVKFYLNGLRVGARDITDRAVTVIALDLALLRPRENVLTLDTPDAAIPSEFGIPDGRLLGVQVFSIQIRPGRQ